MLKTEGTLMTSIVSSMFLMLLYSICRRISILIEHRFIGEKILFFHDFYEISFRVQIKFGYFGGMKL